MLIDAQIRLKRVFFCRSVPPEFLRSFLGVALYQNRLIDVDKSNELAKSPSSMFSSAEPGAVTGA